ncbi:MAG: lytic transglycosylase domain-containing protein [Myxococcales bacterium]|nr:lytic transglycosylase domain-containing protein [Myxococcales bacterium]
MMRFSVPFAVVVASFALGTTSSADADIYRCKRADGTQHYTNVREQGRRCQVVVRASKKSRARGSAKKSPSTTRESAKRGTKDPDRYTRYNNLITEAAQVYQLPNSFIRAVMRVESNFNPTVVSRAGAMGLMQLMPRTARSMGVSDPFDVRQNVLGGARYLRILANRFKGDLILTVAAYNAGEAAVEKYEGIPPYQETQRYVRRVLKHYYAYRSETSR